VYFTAPRRRRDSGLMFRALATRHGDRLADRSPTEHDRRVRDALQTL